MKRIFHYVPDASSQIAPLHKRLQWDAWAYLLEFIASMGPQ